MSNSQQKVLNYDGLRHFYNGLTEQFATIETEAKVNGALTSIEQVEASLSNKVDKVSGKGLSTNDYTTEEKSKLAGIATGATNVVVDAALKSGSTNAAQSGAVYTALSNKVDKVSGKGLSTNDFTTEYLNKINSNSTKLSGIAAGAEVNQNAFSNFKVGSTTIAADGKTDTLELVAGSNIILTPDATNDKITIAISDLDTTLATAGKIADAKAIGDTITNLQNSINTKFNNYATTTALNTAINNLVDGAPEALNTLNELAAALDDNADYYNTVNTLINKKADLIALNAHMSDTENPHKVILSQLGVTASAEELNNNIPIRKEGYIVQHNCLENKGISVTNIIEPIQTGNGDPYPAGSGRNLLKPYVIDSQYAGFQSNGDGIYTCHLTENILLPEPFLFKAGQTYTISLTRVNGTGNNPCIVVRNPSGNTEGQWHNYSNPDTPLTVIFDVDTEWDIMIQSQTVKGYTTIGDSWAIQLELGSTATAYTPYSNIRPISGHTEAKVTRCGKNIAPHAVPESAFGITISPIEHGFRIVGTATDGYNKIIHKSNQWLMAGTYTLSTRLNGSVTGGGGVNVYINANGKMYPLWKNGSLSGVYSYTFMLPDDTYNWSLRIACDSGTTYDVSVSHIQLELGSNVTEYEPYQGETFSADFGQTVYGGTLDWNTGVLTVDMGYAVFNGSENWVIYTYADGKKSFYTSGNGKLSGIVDRFLYIPGLCSWSPTDSNGYITDVLRTDVGSTEIEIKPDVLSKWNINDLNTFKAMLAADPMQITYQLAEPYTVQLTPTQILALENINTVYTNNGPVIVDFNRDIYSSAAGDSFGLVKSGGDVTITNGIININDNSISLNSCDGTLSIAKGGTGATTAASARTNLGITPANIGAVNKNGDTIAGALNLQPIGTGNEGGEIGLFARTSETTKAGIIIDNYNSTLRFFGKASSDGTTKVGTGTPLVIDPYAKTITGGYTITGTLSGNASTASVASKLGTSTIGSSQQPIFLNNGTPTLCSRYSNRIYDYDNCDVYYFRFGGGQDLNWKKVAAFSHPAGSGNGSGEYIGAIAKGIIYRHKGNYEQNEVDEYAFQMNMCFVSNGNTEDSCILRTAAGCPGDIIRAVRVGTNSFELQIGQMQNWEKMSIQFSVNGDAQNIQVFEPVNSSNNSVIPSDILSNSVAYRSLTCSGNSETATRLQTPRTIFGKQSFNGTGDVAGRALFYGTYNADVMSRYSTGAIEIRENDLVQSNQTSNDYAPQIGFHWSSKVAGQLALHNDGKFAFITQNGNVATVKANLEGHASSASKIYISELDSTTYTSRPVTFASSWSHENQDLNYNDALVIGNRCGTSSESGVIDLLIGNSTKAGVAGNKSGNVVLYGNNAGFTALIPQNHTDNHVYLNLPATNGELALTSSNVASANKVNNNLAIKLNGGTTEGTNLFTFNGSAAKTVNITPSAIGAQPSLGYTPVRQGGGTDQGNNIVKIGWATDGSGLRCTVDVSDMGYIYTSRTSYHVINLIYPVGSIYMSTNSTSPATLFGIGTWERIQDRFLLAAGTSYGAGTSGGEAYHTLTIGETPAHNHTPSDSTHYFQTAVGGLNASDIARKEIGLDGNSSTWVIAQTGGGYDHLGTLSATSTVGSNGAHNNMPPYYTVYVWKRTA